MRPHRSFRAIRVAGFDSVQNDSVVIQRQVLGALAQCYKGGSPVTSGTVVMRRLKPDKIDVSLRGFFRNSEKPEVFYRCHVQGGNARRRFPHDDAAGAEIRVWVGDP